jgi:3',5'-cyclic AMP phosphodiesterase CpdA
MNGGVNQLCILHLSDIHYGKYHRFSAPVGPDGSRLSDRGIPTLLESLQSDWKSTVAGCPVVVAVTGDLAQDAKQDEIDAARTFLEDLTNGPVLGEPVQRDRLFVVPGNHDVIFDEKIKERRWQPYCSFYHDFFRRETSARVPEDLNRVHDRSKDLGIIVVELNSCVHIVKDSPDEMRGQIDRGSIAAVEEQLKKIKRSALDHSVRIALIHHHVVLLPALLEANRGYDAVLYGNDLLRILRRYRFHLVLHGHKHYPHVFSYDPASAWVKARTPPMLIVAGGSVASTQFPVPDIGSNTYNRIMVTWNPAVGEMRLAVETRGLVTKDKNNEDLLPLQWSWRSLYIDDRVLTPSRYSYAPARGQSVPFNDGQAAWSEEARQAQYRELRGNMPFVEIVPALRPGKAYVARVSLVPHYPDGQPELREVPVEVTWSAGTKFEMVVCKAEDGLDFAATFEYSAGMLVQARIRFTDGQTAAGYVYAPVPER